MAPTFGILQSILCSSELSTKLIFLILVPTFTTDELPFTFKSLITTTSSPLLRVLLTAVKQHSKI